MLKDIQIKFWVIYLNNVVIFHFVSSEKSTKDTDLIKSKSNDQEN